MEKGRIDWNAIRAEYIGGGISQRKLAEKHKIAFSALRRQAVAGKWTSLRNDAEHKASIKAVQKTADLASENAATISRIRAKMLKKIEAEIDSLPENMGTEYRESSGPNSDWVRIRRLRDLSASLKDLTADQPKSGQGEEILQKAWEILGGVQSAIQ